MRRTIPIDPVLAADLARRRRAAGITQNALALELGLSEAAISKVETARIPVPPQIRDAIEQAIDRLAFSRAS